MLNGMQKFWLWFGVIWYILFTYDYSQRENIYRSDDKRYQQWVIGIVAVTAIGFLSAMPKKRDDESPGKEEDNNKP